MHGCKELLLHAILRKLEWSNNYSYGFIALPHTLFMFEVLGFMATDGGVSPSQLTFPESGKKVAINVSFIKGAFTPFYYYQMNVIASEGTASK